MPMIVVTALATRAYFRDRFASACSLLYYCGRRLVCGTAMPVVVWQRQRPWHSVVVLPCVVHWAVLGVVAVLFMHVQVRRWSVPPSTALVNTLLVSCGQVITRFLSACPALYVGAMCVSATTRFDLGGHVTWTWQVLVPSDAVVCAQVMDRCPGLVCGLHRCRCCAVQLVLPVDISQHSTV